MCRHLDPEPGSVEEVVLDMGHQGQQIEGRLWPDGGYTWGFCSFSVGWGRGGCRTCELRAVQAGAAHCLHEFAAGGPVDAVRGCPLLGELMPLGQPEPILGA